MQQPTRLISTPFAQEGEKTEIQNVTGEFDNSATYRLGFPPLTMQSIRLGGKPPKGTDFNGVLFDITENISFLCKGGRYQYNAGLSTLIGGYPEGSNLLLDDNVTEVVSTVAGNQNNPNTDMTGWTFKPNKTTAVNVADASGETQQQVNYNGGSKWHSRVGGYLKNERVVLTNGDIVKSTIDGNVNDPNVDMTGWVNRESISRSVLDYGARSNANSSQSFDSTQAFKDALDFEWVTYPHSASLAYYPKAKNKRVRVPVGRYLITDTLPLSSYLNLDFDDGVVIDFKPTTLKDLFAPPLNKMQGAYESGATSWKDMAIYGLRITGAALFKGDLTSNGTVYANCAVRAANSHKGLFSRFAIENFKEGLRIDRLDTSAWTGSRIGNFYENVVDNVSIQDCTLPFYNSGNLTTLINSRIGHEFLRPDDVNGGDYLLMNEGAGFSCLNLNIASVDRLNTPKLGMIYDQCFGSTYQGMYTEYPNNLFVLDPTERFGGIDMGCNYTFKYPNDVFVKFVDGYMPSYDPATNTRSGKNLKGPNKWVELQSNGFKFGNSNADLLDDFFEFAPQIDFKYGLYGTYLDWSRQIAVDFKRHETDRNSGFLSKNGARFIATQQSDLHVPIKNNQYDAYVCVLARVISGTFAGGSIKLNSDLVGNDFITSAETYYDYGNGWKMYVVRNVNLDPKRSSELLISFSEGDQVEIEHIGAYKNGVPIYPAFKDCIPKVNANNFMYAGNIEVSSYKKASGGQFATGDMLSPFIPVINGAVDTARDITFSYVSTEGTNRQNLLDGNYVGYYGNANITFANANTFDSAVTTTGNSRNFAESIGVGQYVGITQDAILTDDAKVIDRVYSVPDSKYTTSLVLNKNFNVAVAIANHYGAQKPVYKTVRGVDVAKTPSGSKNYDPPSLAANAIQSTTVTVTGAKVGDSVNVSFSVTLGLSSRMWGEVTALNTVTVYHQNLTAAPLNIANGILTVKVSQ